MRSSLALVCVLEALTIDGLASAQDAATPPNAAAAPTPTGTTTEPAPPAPVVTNPNSPAPPGAGVFPNSPAPDVNAPRTNDAASSNAAGASTKLNATSDVAPAREAASSWTEKLKLGGGATLWYYQPTVDGQKNNLDFFNTRLTIDADFGDGFGFYLEPRIRDTKLRSFFAGTAWIEQGYASYRFGDHKLKVGKVYSQLGLFWDNSFWGNVQVYAGLKLAPDYGASLEGKFEVDPAWGVGYAAQFFLIDGSTNVSLPGRDTISVPDSRRRNQVVLRAEPYLNFAKDGVAKVGLSTQHFDADSPAIADGSVWRYAADLKVALGGFGVWGEYLRQQGQSVSAYPIEEIPATDTEGAVPGRAAKKIDYYLAGAEYTYGRFTARYTFSAARYAGLKVKEWMHVPALGFKVNDNLQLGAEYVHWTRSFSGNHDKYNRSLNVLVFVKF
ncbi:MAG TPA: hypothetical protein VFQ61_31925 [Polyangiaceae bacterium]|nr:hypothetical protein [Polyangiaceae bacterium]